MSEIITLILVILVSSIAPTKRSISFTFLGSQVAPYCATKWAVEGLSKSLAKEVPPGLTVVTLNPGVINTAMLQSCFGASATMYPTPEDWYVVVAPMTRS